MAGSNAAIMTTILAKNGGRSPIALLPKLDPTALAIQLVKINVFLANISVRALRFASAANMTIPAAPLGAATKIAIPAVILAATTAANAAKPNHLARKIAAITISVRPHCRAAPAIWKNSNAPMPAARSCAATAGANAIARKHPRLT